MWNHASPGMYGGNMLGSYQFNILKNIEDNEDKIPAVMEVYLFLPANLTLK